MAFFNFVLLPPYSMLMIRSLHNALDLKFIHDNIGICFRIGVAGMKNKLFVLLIEAKFLQIVLSIKQRDDEIALVGCLLTLHKNIISGEDARTNHALTFGADVARLERDRVRQAI